MSTFELLVFGTWLVVAAIAAWKYYCGYCHKTLFYMTGTEMAAVVMVDVASAAAVGAIWPLLAVVAAIEYVADRMGAA